MKRRNDTLGLVIIKLLLVLVAVYFFNYGFYTLLMYGIEYRTYFFQYWLYSLVGYPLNLISFGIFALYLIKKFNYYAIPIFGFSYTLFEVIPIIFFPPYPYVFYPFLINIFQPIMILLLILSYRLMKDKIKSYKPLLLVIPYYIIQYIEVQKYYTITVWGDWLLALISITITFMMITYGNRNRPNTN